MVLETLDPNFQDWLTNWRTGLPAGMLNWLTVVGFLSLLALFIGYLFAAVAHGPIAGLKLVLQSVGGVILDWVYVSPRRVLALSWLAFKESIRRRVLVVVGVFAVLLLMAGLFLDASGERADRMYLAFVLTATAYLMLFLAMVLSTFSIPTDIKDRTIFTIVSKPVRRNEVFLGRLFGFTATGTVLLAIMGVLSYGFVVRGLQHEHRIDEGNLKEVAPLPGETEPVVRRGLTNSVNGHRHIVEQRDDGTPNGKWIVDDGPGHTHEVTVETDSQGRKTYKFSGPIGLLRARVPMYGSLQYLDRDGKPSAGINVGKEWTYRQCIEGGNRVKCAAIWTFTNLDKDYFPNGMVFELTQGVFRTYKGTIDQGILGSIVLRNPRTQVESTPREFVAREFYTQQFKFGVPTQTDQGNVLKIETPQGDRELFRDFVDGGALEVVIRCKEAAQYYCVAGPDLYIRGDDANFELNFLKGYWGIWLQMVLVIAFGTMWSTFLRGPVALLATAGTTLVGFFVQFMIDLYKGALPGGGPTEAFYRIVTQKNAVVELDPGVGKEAIGIVDAAIKNILFWVQQAVPDLLSFNDSAYVANGFNIGLGHLAQHTVAALAFLIPVVIVGHFALKFRQVAE
ncbi:MAG TPA: hypothetical protein VGE52_01715 [Pirellulales bacterium]